MAINVQQNPAVVQRFWIDFRRAVCEAVRESEEKAHEAWSALTNVVWKNKQGETASLSFRTAGTLVADMRNEFDPLPEEPSQNMAYLRYYLQSTEGVVADWIKKALKTHDWVPYDHEGNHL